MSRIGHVQAVPCTLLTLRVLFPPRQNSFSNLSHRFRMRSPLLEMAEQGRQRNRRATRPHNIAIIVLFGESGFQVLRKIGKLLSLGINVAFAVPVLWVDADGGSDVKVTGGSFTCKANNGGFLYASDGTIVEVAGGSITECTADENGGAVSHRRKGHALCNA